MAWARVHFKQTWAFDGSVLDGLLKKCGLVQGTEGPLLAGKIGTMLDVITQMPARRLPNRYAGPHPTRRRSRRLNRRLAGLCRQGDAGNGRGGMRADDRRAMKRRYYPDGGAAARGWLRCSGPAWVYWPGRGAAEGGVGFWYGLPGDGRQPA